MVGLAAIDNPCYPCFMIPSAPWLHEARQLPLAFAQVREDTLLDLAVVERLKAPARVCLIASGGCTAALLATASSVAHLHLVDVNPAQLALARLKLHLLQRRSPAERLALIGHVPMAASERSRAMEEELTALRLPGDCLGPPEVIGRLGPDHAGRYELLFAQLRKMLAEFERELDDLLGLNEPNQQAAKAHSETPLGRALDRAFDEVMALSNLVALFGEGATRNRVEPFARHFARRTRHVLATLPAASNPYLWQMLRGRFPPRVVYPWLMAPPPSRFPEITWSATPMAEALAKVPGEFDLVHLSNILDWLSESEAQKTLELAERALRPGGWVIIRQLNSTLDIPALGRFRWQAEAERLHARDRSFFYRGLYLGRKP